MTGRRPGRGRARTPAEPGPGSAAPAPETRPPIDPRAVRVTVSAAGRVDGDPTMIVSPPSDPVLRPIERLAGTAILGGIPSPVDRSGDGHGAGLEPPRDPGTPPSRLVEVDGATAQVELERLDDEHAVLVDGADAEGRTRVILGPVHRRETDGIVVRELVVDGWRIEVELEPERRASLRERARRALDASGRGGPVEVHAIIPGRIVALSVAAGDAVEAGQQLLVLEAMKMQNELRAPREGSIERIPIAVGDNVEVGDLLMVIT
jgi:biotin carboxyl carrier protein